MATAIGNETATDFVTAASGGTATVTLTGEFPGTVGNVTLALDGTPAGLTVSGANLTGGANGSNACSNSTTGTYATSNNTTTLAGNINSAIALCPAAIGFTSKASTNTVTVTDNTFGYQANTFTVGGAGTSGVFSWGAITPGSNGSNTCTSPTSGTFQLNTASTVPTTTTEANNFATELTACNTSNAKVGLTATNSGSGVTATADVAGSTPGVSAASTFSNFTWSGGGAFTNGTNGTTSSTTFAYWAGGTYDTAAQVAANIVTAVNSNTTLNVPLTATQGTGGNTNQIIFSAAQPGTGSNLTVTPNGSFSAFTPTVTLSGGTNGTTNTGSTPETFAYWSGSAPVSSSTLASTIQSLVAANSTLTAVLGAQANSPANDDITFTAKTAGTGGNSYTVTPGSFGAFAGGSLGGGAWGNDSATTFNFLNSTGGYETAAQLASDLATAFGDNSTLTAAITAVPSGNTVVLTAVEPGAAGNSYSASDSGFSALGTLPNGGNFSGGESSAVLANSYPAKYVFSTTTTPSCSDYIVYPTGGTGATLIAYNNIYTGTCTTGNVPNVAWAYNTGNGATVTSTLSPILSLDGKQVAYIQTTSSNVAELVILRPLAGTNNGTISLPVAATYEAPGSYLGCTAPCYTTIALDYSPNDTNSSPIYDYNTVGGDILWVGDNSGRLHEFTGVFLGTPAEVETGGWPIITVGANILTSPVYDSVSGNIFVADSGGYLYSYNASTAAHEMTSSKLTASGVGIADGPMVDSTAEEVYVSVGDDANTSSSDACTTTTGCSGVFQFSATINSGITGTGACGATSSSTTWVTGTNCGVEAIFGVGAYPTMYDGAFDNTYYSGSGKIGYLWECAPSNAGGIQIAPRLSAVAIQSSGSIVPSNRVSSAADVTTAISSLTSNTPSVAGSPVTEFYNTGQTGTPVTTTSGSLATGATTVTVNSVSGIAVGNYIQMGSEDMLVTAVDSGTNTLTLVRGAVGTTQNPVTYGSGTSVYIPAIDYLYLSVTENGNVTDKALACTGACLYSVAVGTPAGSYVATGMTPTNGLASAGGTSGIVVDDSGTTAGESQIYYSSLGSTQSCAGNTVTGSGTGSCAVQTSQTAP
jgi:hypothetical protein